MRRGAATLLLPLLVGLAGAGSAATSLPASGIAVQTAQGVELLSLEGRKLRDLRGFRFRVYGVQRVGQLELRGPGGAYELRHGLLARVPGGTITLTHGHRLVAGARWRLLRGDVFIQAYPRLTQFFLDDAARILTFFLLTRDGRAIRNPVSIDLATLNRGSLPRTCWVAAQRAGVRFDVCGRPYSKSTPSRIVRNGRVLAGPVEPVGHWARVQLSPDGRELLAQWSGECEVPTAYLVDARTGALTRLGNGVEGRVLGWTRDGALVALPRSVCTGSAAPPGVYAFDRRGRGRLLMRLPSAIGTTVGLWR